MTITTEIGETFIKKTEMDYMCQIYDSIFKGKSYKTVILLILH